MPALGSWRAAALRRLSERWARKAGRARGGSCPKSSRLWCRLAPCRTVTAEFISLPVCYCTHESEGQTAAGVGAPFPIDVWAAQRFGRRIDRLQLTNHLQARRRRRDLPLQARAVQRTQNRLRAIRAERKHSLLWSGQAPACLIGSRKKSLI